MKVKLLKKLRKRAKRRYWIEDWSSLKVNKFVVRSLFDGEKGYKASFEYLNGAKTYVGMLRRDFIFSELAAMKISAGKLRIDY